MTTECKPVLHDAHIYLRIEIISYDVAELQTRTNGKRILNLNCRNLSVDTNGTRTQNPLNKCACEVVRQLR
jgi:hypothetical protein